MKLCQTDDTDDKVLHLLHKMAAQLTSNHPASVRMAAVISLCKECTGMTVDIILCVRV